MNNDNRGLGRTTAQMINAPRNAIFIWCNNLTVYAEKLAKKLGRDDLKIYPSYILDDHGFWLGRIFAGLVIDHATELREKQREILYTYALPSIKP